MSRKERTIAFAGLVFAIMASGCGANEGILRSSKETPAAINAVSEKSSFDKDLEAMRIAGFAFIYVLRRKNGGTIDAEDIRVIKLQTVDTNRRVKTDDDRAVIVGSNFQIPAANLAALDDRFAVENYSQPPAAAANTNANTDK